jgi:hypothetical protein
MRLKRLDSLRSFALHAVWSLSDWLATRRRAQPTPGQMRRLDISTRTRGRGMRMTEWLRDRLRPGWLRVRRDDESAA